jgi:KDO2-lipid IV(A) lauroyltransferase
MSEKYPITSSFRRRIKKTRRFLYPLALRPLGIWVKSLTDAECETWAKRLGALCYRVLSKARVRATSNLSKAFGSQLTSDQINQIGREVFQNLALNFFECGRFGHIPAEHLLKKIEVEGWEHLEAAYQSGRGGVLLGGHIGNWELTAAYIALRGYPINVVARRIYIDSLNEKLVKMRENMGMKILYRGISMRRMIRLLLDNQFIGVLADQDVKDVSGIFVDFFGHPAFTTAGPALLALASGAPIIIIRDVRQGSRHRITVDPPILANREAPRHQEVNRIVTLYTARLEEFIREHPSQWVWTHRRWRTRPSVT